MHSGGREFDPLQLHQCGINRTLGIIYAVTQFNEDGFFYLYLSISYLQIISNLESNQYKNSLATKALIINKLYEEPIVNPNPAYISLDTLSKEFNDGDYICLDILKEKGLVSNDSNKLIVKDGTMLDKKLFIDADGYAANVIKMVFLTGGEAKINRRVKKQIN